MIEMKTAFRYIVFFLILFITCTAGAQQKITFNRVLPGEGKNFLHITGIVQDKQGYMWFASKKGLYRYDGYTITYYKNDPLNPKSLISNYLESICIDSNGIIWIGTYSSGLERFDPLTETFSHFRHDAKNSSSLSNDSVFAVLQDRNGILWSGGPGGLDRYDAKTNTFTNYHHQAGDSNSISSNMVRAIYEDHAGTLWIGTGSPYPDDGGGPLDGGLNKMDSKTGKFSIYRNEPGNEHSLINNKVRAIFEDSKGIFWVGTAGDGLHTMNRETGSFERYTYNAADTQKLSRPPLSAVPYDHITFIREDAAGAIWIGTSDAGISRYDAATKKMQHFNSKDKSNATDGSSFNDNSSWAAYTSGEGVFWMSTIDGNLYRIDPFNRNFPFIPLPSSANSFYEDASGSLWIATWKGLYKNDSLNQHKGLPASLVNSPDSLVRISEDRQGNIWMSGAGLFLFDKKRQSFIQYRHDSKNSKSLSDDIVLSMFEDDQSNFWVGTFRGLDKMDRKTGEFTNYKMIPQDTGMTGNMVLSILEDKKDKFWVGSFSGGGIFLFDKEKQSFKNYLGGLAIRCIYDDFENVLWVGADDGLYRYNRSLDVFSRYTDSSSSVDIDDVASLVEDDQQNLWVSASNGILRLDRNRGVSKLFAKNYGIDGHDLQWNAYKGRDGRLYFGANAGYYSFIPDQLKNNSKPPVIIFSAFSLGDKLVRPADNSPLKMPLSQTTQIKLSYYQNAFSFEFVAIDYTNPAENRYMFMLENHEKTWHPAGADRRASYYNIPPGKYVFRLKAANSDGVWTEKSIAILITPPWWKTWWAYCIYGLLAVSLAFIIYSVQKRNIIYKERARTKEIELAQAREIEKAYTILKSTQSQLIQAEKMASLGELTAGIAHEIQNPLNFVNNFSEVSKELLAEMKTELDSGNPDTAKEIADDVILNLEKINHHGKRADAIVKGMLQHSQAGKGQKELTDINSLADEYLRLSYHGLRAKDKSFNATMHTDFDPNIGQINIIPQDVGRVLLNLFNNAFYKAPLTAPLSPEGGFSDSAKRQSPTVWLSTKKEGNTIFISVRDNGPGIPENIIDKIFQPFFTTKPTGLGTGLGLSLSYDIIKAHGGEIAVQSKEGVGSEFIVTLPIQ